MYVHTVLLDTLNSTTSLLLKITRGMNEYTLRLKSVIINVGTITNTKVEFRVSIGGM